MKKHIFSEKHTLTALIAHIVSVLIVLIALVFLTVPQKIPDARTNDGRVIIALIDTGISPLAIDESRILKGHNYVNSAAENDTCDRINHGTAAASVITGCESAKLEGIAPDAYLVPLVVTDKIDGGTVSVTPEVLAQAIRDAADIYNADIINVSLGIKNDSEVLREAVLYAEEKGALTVSAVGNDGNSGDRYYPAAYETVLAVGSHDKNGELSVFSQQNGTADILAPGEDIWLASRNGVTLGAKGTSYATAYVSAAAALLLGENPKMTPSELREKIKSSARDICEPGFDAKSGFGILEY